MTYPTRTAWRAARSEFVRDYMTTADPYLDAADAPDWIRDDMPPADWLALDRTDRADRLRRAARRVFETEVPIPPPAGPVDVARRVVPPSTPPHRLTPHPPRYASEGAWKFARRSYVEKRFMYAAAPFIVGDHVAETPPWVFNAASGFTRADWVALSPEARRERALRSGYRIFDAAFPSPRDVDPDDAEAWTRHALPGEYGDRSAPTPATAQAVAQRVAEPEPAQDSTPTPSPSGRRAVVLCPACGEYVNARPGRAAVPAVGGRCSHD